MYNVSHKPPPLCVVVRVEAYDSHEDNLFFHDLPYISQASEGNNVHTLIMMKGKSHFSINKCLCYNQVSFHTHPNPFSCNSSKGMNHHTLATMLLLSL